MKSRLRKLAMDFGDRDFAVAYIDGEVISASTHANCINKYLMEKTKHSMWAVRRRPNINDEQFDKLDNGDVDNIHSEDYLTENEKEDLKMIKDNIKQIAFAHAVDGSNENSGYCEEDGKHIYIERDTLYNVDFNTVVLAMKQAYPEYDIHIEETEEKVARLKKAWLEGYDKDRKAAIVYINGKVYESQNHAGAICEYYEDGNEENEHGNEIAVGYLKSDGNIYIALDALQNIPRYQIDKVLFAIKEKYPNSQIYQDSFYSNKDSNSKTRLAKLNKIAGPSLVMFDYLTLDSGDVIEFTGRICSNMPWFQITHESHFCNSSYYDGPDFDRAVNLYEEILLAFKGAKGAEKAKKIKSMFDSKINQLKKEDSTFRTQDLYRVLKEQPLFLGMNFF